MFFQINNRALLKVSGSDAESFLQAQLSNDIHKLDTKNIQLNAYCQHQGKIISLFWVMKHEECFLLSFPNDLLNKIESLVNTTINEFAIEEGFDLILYNDAVFVSDKVNITHQIIEKIEKQSP